MRNVQVFYTGQLTANIQWRFEVLNAHNIFISFLEDGLTPTVNAKWINIIKQCLAAASGHVTVQDHISAYTSLLLDIAEPVNEQTIAQLQEALNQWVIIDRAIDESDILEVPVLYDEAVGLDLAEIALQNNLSTEAIIRLHTEETYRVYALGFSPGFAFMGQVNERLRLTRRSTPRQKVPQGAVAIAENQTAIYPNESPGGWHVLGRCPIKLFDSDKQPPNTFKVGQRVKFKPVDKDCYLGLLVDNKEVPGALAPCVKSKDISILKASGLAIIIDKGRQAAQQEGLSESGPMDANAFRWANKLLGNNINAPMIEVTMGGLSLQVNCDTVFSLTGADLNAELEQVNGRRKALSSWLSYRVQQGETIHLNHFKQQGLRAYIAFQGGLTFSYQPLFDSYSTVVREALGGHRNNGSVLQKGDGLCIDHHDDIKEKIKLAHYLKATPYRYRSVNNNNDVLRLKLKLAYQAELFSACALQCFLQQTYEISQLIDRMAYRLIAHDKIAVPAQGINSEGIALGSVQITPDGEPIVLMRDRQTIGGYPKIAVLTEDSVNALAQAVPGQHVEFYC